MVVDKSVVTLGDVELRIGLTTLLLSLPPLVSQPKVNFPLVVCSLLAFPGVTKYPDFSHTLTTD